MIEFYSSLAAGIVMVIVAFLLIISVPFIKETVIPWLKEKRLYALVQKFVEAAEKLASTGEIPKEGKKAYVLELLRNIGYEPTAVMEAFIESAVTKLDLAFDSIWSGVIGEFEDQFDFELEEETEEETDA